LCKKIESVLCGFEWVGLNHRLGIQILNIRKVQHFLYKYYLVLVIKDIRKQKFQKFCYIHESLQIFFKFWEKTWIRSLVQTPLDLHSGVMAAGAGRGSCLNFGLLGNYRKIFSSENFHSCGDPHFRHNLWQKFQLSVGIPLEIWASLGNLQLACGLAYFINPDVMWCRTTLGHLLYNCCTEYVLHSVLEITRKSVTPCLHDEAGSTSTHIQCHSSLSTHWAGLINAW